MALSGSMTTGESGGRSLTFSWTATQNIANNTSTVSWSLSTSGSESQGVSIHEVTAKINNTQVYHTDNLNNSWSGATTYPQPGWTFKTGTTTITHNASGAGSFTAYLGGGIYSQWAINKEVSKTFTLNTIARASKVKITSGFTLGSQGTIQIYDVANTSFKHTLRYVWGSEAGVIASNLTTSGTTINQNWTPPIETFAAYIPNNETGYGTIGVDTYSGSTLIGQSTCSFYGTMPSTAVPTISNVAVAMVNDNSTVSGWGVAVKGYTKARITASGAGVYSSTISNFGITGGYTKTVAGTSLDYTGEPLSTSGTVSFSVKAVDSRGRESTATTKSLTVYDYASPNISTFSVARQSTATNNVQVTANWSFSSVNNKNAATATLKYKTRSASSWTTYSGTITKGGTTTLSPTFSVSTSYDFQLTITDSLGNTAISTGSVSTQDVLLDFRAGGAGLGIGKIIESDNLVEIKDDWDFKVHGEEILDLIDSDHTVKFTGTGNVGDANTPIYLAGGVPTAMVLGDYVMEYGSATSGFNSVIDAGKIEWQKWHSGKLEYWGYTRAAVNAQITSSTWNGYVSTSRLTFWGTWPIAFVGYAPHSTYRMVAADNGYTGDYWIIESPYLNASGTTVLTPLTESPWFKLWRGTSATFGHPQFTFYVVGRWK